MGACDVILSHDGHDSGQPDPPEISLSDVTMFDKGMLPDPSLVYLSDIF
jgi:hypothetical protein